MCLSSLGPEENHFGEDFKEKCLKHHSNDILIIKHLRVTVP